MKEKNFTHLIFITSNYEEGKRYGLHYVLTKKNNIEINNLVQKYSSKDNVALYSVITDSASLDSVKEKEPFFSEVIMIDGSANISSEKFEKKFNNKLDAIDFALLILTRKKYSFFDLLILIYHCYCEYACKYGVVLFDDKLYIDSKKKEKGFEIKSLSKYFTKITNTDYRELFKNFSYEKEASKMPKLKIEQSDVAYSKFFNVENGIVLMTRFIEIFEKINKYDLKYLYKEIVTDSSLITQSKKETSFITYKNIRKYYKSHINNW